MIVMQWRLATVAGDDLAIPAEIVGEDGVYIVVLPQIVADQIFRRSGTRLLADLTYARESIIGAAERAWKPNRLRPTTSNGEPATRLWLKFEDFATPLG